jgi:hypothetical protein
MSSRSQSDDFFDWVLRGQSNRGALSLSFIMSAIDGGIIVHSTSSVEHAVDHVLSELVRRACTTSALVFTRCSREMLYQPHAASKPSVSISSGRLQ